MQRFPFSLGFLGPALLAAGLFVAVLPAKAQESQPTDWYTKFLPPVDGPAPLRPEEVLQPLQYVGTKPPVEVPLPAAGEPPLPIDLPTALRLVNVRSLDIAIAAQGIQQARALLTQAKYAWLPTITMGPDYYNHNGRIQTVQGPPIDTSRSAFNTGVGISAIFTPAEVVFSALAARQVMRSRQADFEATSNNTLLSVAEAYFSVQQARGEMAGAAAAVQYAEELAQRAEKLALGLALPLEAARARAELARRRQAMRAAQERWEVTGAELARVLRLGPTTRIDPTEPPHLHVTLIALDQPVDALIPIGLRNRPELASQQALVEATLQRLRQERIRPLMPSIILSGAGPGATAPSSVSVFGAGNTALNDYGVRTDIDLQVVWVLQNLGMGNLAKIKARQAENRAAVLAMYRLQDRVAAEVVQAYAQAQSAAERMKQSEAGLKEAADSITKNFQGLSQTRRAGDLTILMVRPQEVVAAIQSLSFAYADFYGAVGDFNRAQFRLYRALGYPAQLVGGNNPNCAPSN